MPTIRINVEPRFLGRFEKKIAESLRQNRIQSAFRRAGQKAVAMLRQKSASIRYRGKFSEGWYFKISGLMMTLGNDAPNFIYVEAGRGPGKMPPVKEIELWVLSKGMQADAAFPVARAIGARGIKARPVFTQTETQKEMSSIVTKELNSFFDRVIMEATR